MTTMPKPILVLDDLKSKFSQFGAIADLVGSLHKTFVTLHAENVRYGGEHDMIGAAYHREIDVPTNDLLTLVDNIAAMFRLTGVNGGVAADGFHNADNDAKGAASGW
jgi:hypothetical protein